MEIAEISIHRSGSPASVMLTSYYFLTTSLVLSEIESFSWVTYRSDSILEIFIRKDSIFISIELIKKYLEFLFIDIDTPMHEIKLKFMRLDFASFI
jgi:hypothetical protein